MATVRTPPPSHGPGVDQALDHWQDYKQQALHNLAQMKGHIAEADKLRSDQKAAELSRETEQELAAARRRFWVNATGSSRPPPCGVSRAFCRSEVPPPAPLILGCFWCRVVGLPPRFFTMQAHH